MTIWRTNASGQQIGFIGVNGGDQGGWFKTLAVGGTGILMQGGMNPELKIDYYEDLLRSLRERYEIHLHCFSPPEIVVLAKLSKLSVREAIRRLIAAGLDSIPGGGAEILTDRMRRSISPGKCWLLS